MEELLFEVGHPNYKLLCDIGNFVCADEDFATACGRLFPMAAHVHAKDMFCRSGDRYAPGEGWIELRSGNYVRPTVLGHGDVPVYQILRALKKSGYDGFVSIEFEGMEDNLDALRISADNLKRMLADIE